MERLDAMCKVKAQRADTCLEKRHASIASALRAHDVWRIPGTVKGPPSSRSLLSSMSAAGL